MSFNYKTFDLISCLFVFRLFHWIFHSIEYRIFITSDSNVWKYLSFCLKATIFLQIFFYLLITAENMDLWIINIHFASHFQWFRRNHRTKLSNNCIIVEHKKVYVAAINVCTGSVIHWSLKKFCHLPCIVGLLYIS